MAAPALRRFAEKFDDELRFFRGWIDKPKAVGSIVPTSSVDRATHGLDHRHRIRACPCWRSGPEPASSPGRSWRVGSGRGSLYTVEYSADFVAPSEAQFS